MDQETEGRTQSESVEPSRIGELLDAAGWGLFFIWLGVAFLADVGFGIGILGIGAIALAEQVARKISGLRLEGFWVVVGLLFILGGLWELLEVPIELVPVLLILLGLTLLSAALKGKHLARKRHRA